MYFAIFIFVRNCHTLGIFRYIDELNPLFESDVWIILKNTADILLCHQTTRDGKDLELVVRGIEILYVHDLPLPHNFLFSARYDGPTYP